MPDTEKPQEDQNGAKSNAGGGELDASAARTSESTLKPRRRRRPTPVVACATCGSVGPAKARLPGNRTRSSLIIIGALFAALGCVGIFAGVVLDPGRPDVPAGVVALRIAAGFLVGLGLLILVIRLFRWSHEACETCGMRFTIPIDSPIGRELSLDSSLEAAAAGGNVGRNPFWLRLGVALAVVVLLAGGAAVGASIGFAKGRAQGMWEGSDYYSQRQNTMPRTVPSRKCAATPDLTGTPYPGTQPYDCVTAPGGMVSFNEVTLTVTSLTRSIAVDGTPQLCAAIVVRAGAAPYSYSWDNWSLHDPAGATRGAFGNVGGRVTLVPGGQTKQRYCFVDPGIGGQYLVIDPPSNPSATYLRTIWVFNLPPA